jgi:hypothetical protein
MLKTLLLFTIALAGSLMIASVPVNAKNSSVNSADTVFFDLSKASVNGDDVEFPVYFRSDDSVFSFDFSFKFNEGNLIYDSIINLTLHLQPTSYYNHTDSTVRFESYKNNNEIYANNTAIVAIHFTTIFKYITSVDLKSVKAWLNGDPCSVKVTEALFTNVKENKTEAATIYSNPVSEQIYIHAPVNAAVHVYDLTGNEICTKAAAKDHVLDAKGLARGIYIVKANAEGVVTTRKIVIP